MSTLGISSSMQIHDALTLEQEALGKITPSSSGEAGQGSDHSELRNSPNGTTTSDHQLGVRLASFTSDESHSMLQKLLEIFSENVTAKMLRVAREGLENNVSGEPQLYFGCIF
jgi:hypothetical protein